MATFYYSYPPTSIATSGLATEAKQDITNTRVGDLTEVAPATDTASSGLNGRLQRLAQRITTLISTVATETTLAALSAKFSSLGQKAMTASAPVVIASDQSVLPVSGPLTDTQLRATAVPVSGPLTDTQLRATAVPVSAASLPLPSGAATEATLSTLSGKVAAFDLDTGAGTQNVQGVSLRKSASGGSVELGTSTDPVRVDPTGATTQPISAASLPLPTGAATSAAQTTAQTSLTNIEANTGRSPRNANATESAGATVGTTAVSEAAPADAVGFFLSADPANTGTVYWRASGTAVAGSAHPLEASRDTGVIPLAANLSLIASVAAQKYTLTWIRR